MTETTFYQFSREVWQAVTDQARNALLRKEFSPEESKIESLRCVFLEEEKNRPMVGRSGSLKLSASTR